MIEAGFTEGRNLIVIGQVRVNDETEIPGKVNWCQTATRNKRKRMTGKFGKLLWTSYEETAKTIEDYCHVVGNVEVAI